MPPAPGARGSSKPPPAPPPTTSDIPESPLLTFHLKSPTWPLTTVPQAVAQPFGFPLSSSGGSEVGRDPILRSPPQLFPGEVSHPCVSGHSGPEILPLPGTDWPGHWDRQASSCFLSTSPQAPGWEQSLGEGFPPQGSGGPGRREPKGSSEAEAWGHAPPPSPQPAAPQDPRPSETRGHVCFRSAALTGRTVATTLSPLPAPICAPCDFFSPQ